VCHFYERSVVVKGLKKLAGFPDFYSSVEPKWVLSRKAGAAPTVYEQ
jgi:hypothetical protein